MARRTSDASERLTRRLSFRLSESEWHAYCQRFQASGLTQSEFFRRCVLSNRTELVEDTRRAVWLHAANKVGNNLNQLAHAVHIARLAERLGEVTFVSVIDHLCWIEQFLDGLVGGRAPALATATQGVSIARAADFEKSATRQRFGADERLDRKLSFRMTEPDWTTYCQRFQASGLSQSEFFRSCVLTNRPALVVNSPRLRLMYEVNKAGNNLGQLGSAGRAAHLLGRLGRVTYLSLIDHLSWVEQALIGLVKDAD